MACCEQFSWDHYPEGAIPEKPKLPAGYIILPLREATVTAGPKGT